MNTTKDLTNGAIQSKIQVWQHIERGIMDEEKLVSLLKDRGWTYTPRFRRSRGKRYIYAQKRQGTEIIERYIAPFSRLDKLTPAFIIEKLENTSPKTERATKHSSLCKSYCLVA